MDTFSNTVQNTLTHKTFSTSKGRHLLPQVLSAMQSFWQLIYRPVNCCMISSERPPTHGSIQVVPRTVSLWFHHTRPVQVGQRRGLMVVAEAWRTAVPSHWRGSPASCCHCVSRLRLTRGNHIVRQSRSMSGLRKTETPTWIHPFINKNLWPVFKKFQVKKPFSISCLCYCYLTCSMTWLIVLTWKEASAKLSKLKRQNNCNHFTANLERAPQTNVQFCCFITTLLRGRKWLLVTFDIYVITYM